MIWAVLNKLLVYWTREVFHWIKKHIYSNIASCISQSLKNPNKTTFNRLLIVGVFFTWCIIIRLCNFFSGENNIECISGFPGLIFSIFLPLIITPPAFRQAGKLSQISNVICSISVMASGKFLPAGMSPFVWIVNSAYEFDVLRKIMNRLRDVMLPLLGRSRNTTFFIQAWRSHELPPLLLPLESPSFVSFFSATQLHKPPGPWLFDTQRKRNLSF